MKKGISILLSASLVFSMAPGMAVADDVATSELASHDLTTHDETGETQSEVKWEAADFTYVDYEKRLYGCDYSRDFVVSGKVISGFTDAGAEKLATSTELTIPAVDDEGNTIVGVGPEAFKNCGLTSVTFPTGMLTPYNDEATGWVTNRGNFIIAEEAFAKNQLTEVDLPAGVLAVLPNAFKDNQLEKVSLPRTIWWVETLAFANNKISYVDFPETCDFQLELHGMAFADNQIKSVRLPDYTAVVNKHVFVMNPGMEEVAENASDKEKGLGGVVHMYADNIDLQFLDRIHTTDKTTASTKSWHQRLVINDGSPETQNPDEQRWTTADFTYELSENGQSAIVTGLSEAGVAKRETNRKLVIPDRDPDGRWVAEIAAAPTSSSYGVFATEEYGFDSVVLPSGIKKVGARAFMGNGLTDATFPCGIHEIGVAAFQTNQLTSAVVPDTLTVMGSGAFATNPRLERIHIPSQITQIPASAYGCSDAQNWMENLTAVEIPEGVTSIGSRAFAGNNITDIVIPSTVTSIGTYAFSTKNYLKGACTLTLPEGLTTIGNRAFRNKVIASVDLPTTVTKLPALVFEKEYSDGSASVVTQVNVTDYAQYADRTNFPTSDYHKLVYANADQWVAEDFTYGEQTFELYPASDTNDKLTAEVRVVTGFSESGTAKFATNTDVVIPSVDAQGNPVCGVGDSAFARLGLTSVTLPEDVKTANDMWDSTVTERGNFFIGASAFIRNNLTSLDLPEGVIYVGGNAFGSNNLEAVNFPSTIMFIGNPAFYRNNISQLSFPETTDFPLNIDRMAFANNKIKAVQVPSNIEKLTNQAFILNTGMEAVSDSASAAEKRGGVVHVYVSSDDNLGGYLDYLSNGTSYVQELKVGTIPTELAPWGIDDFAYSDDKATVTGLTEAGKAKLKESSTLIIPDYGPDNVATTAIGDGVLGSSTSEEQIGTFGFRETVGDETTAYVPTSVVLPAQLETIGNNAFSAALDNGGNHQGLTSVNFPKSLKSIGSTAFQNAPLTNVVLPEGVSSVGSAAFTTTENSASKIASVSLPSSLTAIPANMFAQQAVDSIVIPEGVTSIGQRAFAGNFGTSLTLPSTLTSIGNYAFWNHQFTEVDIPASVEIIGTYAFQHTNEDHAATLSSLTLHEGLISIGNRAFRNSQLESLDIPTTLRTIHANAFEGSANTVRLLSSVADQAAGEGDYTGVAVNGSGHVVELNKIANTGWSMSDFTFSDDGTAITGFTDAGTAKRLAGNYNLVLPDVAPDGTAITAIADEAFMLSDDEVTQGNYKVNSPSGIQTVSLPAGLKTIGARAFKYNALTAVDFETTPELASIGESAFHGNQLQKVHLPDTLAELGAGAFSTNSITDLKLSSAVTVIPQGAFSMNIRMSQIVIPDTVTEIGDMAFAGARLTALDIPASVEKIGRKAFHLHHIANLTIPGTVKEIGESAFEGTYKEQTLASLELGEGIEAIGSKAFKEGLLERVELPSTVVSLAADAFENNTGYEGSNIVRVVVSKKEQLDLVTESDSMELVLKADEESRAAAAEVEDMIGTLTNESSADQVKAVADAYDALGDMAKGLVSEEAKAKLEAAKKRIAGQNSGTGANDSKSEDKNIKSPVKSAKTFTVNVKNVTAKAVAKAAKKAGATTNSATAIKLGNKVRKISAKSFVKYKSVKTVTLGKKVKQIKKNAFKGSKVRTLIVKTKKLTKKSVRNALKGSKVKTIKVKVGLKKANKRYVKKYKKIFAKTNVGKKVKVKR